MIHVVVSCAERKRHPAERALTVRSLGRGSFEKRLECWLEAISKKREGHRVADLYQGEHWSVARSMSSHAVSVWTASAGFGLLSLDDAIPSYDATFATGQANSVSHSVSTPIRNTERSTWWDEVQARAKRSRVDTLVTLNAEGPVVIAASQAYLSAMKNEILAADKQADHPLVISTAGSISQEFSHLALPCDGRLRNVLGGSMGAVNVRLAKQLVAIPEDEFTQAAAIDRTTRLMADATPLPEFRRKSVSDAEVIEFIRTQQNGSGSASASKLLRRLRDDGMACEQSRFKRLFDGIEPNG